MNYDRRRRLNGCIDRRPRKRRLQTCLIIRPVLPALAILAFTASAEADVIRYSCGKSMVTIDAAKPSVTIHYENGFSETYANGVTASSYKFTDGSETPYVSTESVTIDDKAIRFSNRYRTSAGEITIENEINRQTGAWHHVQSGVSGDTPCSRP